MSQPLTNAQLELLKAFQFQLSAGKLDELQRLLRHFAAEQISDDIDRLFGERDWDDAKLREWESGHYRTPYSREP